MFFFNTLSAGEVSDVDKKTCGIVADDFQARYLAE
jgi:hypothetical protein